jgi:nucleotide-binding universal stress UspA family protein
MFKKIVVPVDFSHHKTGVDMVELAKKLGGDDAKILIVHVMHDLPNYAAFNIPEEVIEKAGESARQELEDLARDTGVKTKPQLRHGAPGPCILDAAEDFEADLIIIASHKPDLTDYFLGSTASRVVRHAQCPVLVVR